MTHVRLQEIVTRAVVGRTERRVVWSHSLPAEGVDRVLGVHISQGKVEVTGDDRPELRFQATCDLWCQQGDETAIRRITPPHTEPASVKLYAHLVGDLATSAQMVRPPRCTGVEVAGDQLVLTIETVVAVEAAGLARFWVKAYDLSAGMDDAESYEESSDSLGSSSSSSSSSSEFADLPQEEEDGLAALASVPDAPPPSPEPALAPVAIPSAGMGTVAHFQQRSSGPRVAVVHSF